MTEICNIYENVMNITNNCKVDILGTQILTPCIPACILALQYAIYKCDYIYGESNLLNKIISLLKKCENPIVKVEIAQFIYGN